MKNIFLLASLLLLFSCEKPEKTIRIYGSVAGLKSPATAKLDENGMSAEIYKNGMLLNPDQEMNFDITLSVEKPGYYYLFRNPLYLSPGDELELIMHEDNQKTEIRGRGEAANNYLKKRFYSKGGSYLDAGRFAFPDQEKMLAAMDSIMADRRATLADLKGVTKEFKELEEIRIQADLVNSLFYYPQYCRGLIPMDASKEEALRIRNDFFASLKDRIQPVLDKLTESDRYLDIEVVRLVLYRFMEVEGFEVRLSPLNKELFEVSEQSGKIRGTITPERYQGFLDFSETIRTPEFKSLFLEKLSENSRLMPGNPAVDFEMINPDGEHVKLSDFKGRMIYVDFWATWCGPCLQESPYFHALKQKYPEVHFLSVSLDDAPQTWTNFLGKKESSDGVVELFSVDPEVRKKWSVGGIPRFLLIDKDFKIVTADAPRPSKGEEIEALL